MDAKRAQQISSDPTMAYVTYNGKQVYIEHVDQSIGVATIHPLDEPTKKESVSVASLMEQ